MGLFSKRGSNASREESPGPAADDVLFRALIGRTDITKDEALNIPSVKSCINFIADTVSMLPIKLYKEDNGKAEEVLNDNRIRLLNDDTGDTLDAVQFWRAMIADYFLGKGGYAYIHREKGIITSLHYVDEGQISIIHSTEAIFKDYSILVKEEAYKPHDFIKLLRNTKDGAGGKGIPSENPLILSVTYNSLVFEENLVKKGGNKKGFLKTLRTLGSDEAKTLKEAWRNLYSNNSENVVLLNNGIDFEEAGNSSVEMQLNENKESNSVEICKLFNMSANIIKGTAAAAEYANTFKTAVMPALRVIECALNRDFLLEKEKKSFYYAFDTKELLKGDIKARFEAYKMAIEANFLGVDEVRFMEDLAPLGIDWIKLGLDSVLYDPKTKTLYTPNTDKTSNLKGGEIVESGNQS